MRRSLHGPQPFGRRAKIASRTLARAALWEDESLTLADLKAKLDEAVEQEDYDLAARIRDTLQ